MEQARISASWKYSEFMVAVFAMGLDEAKREGTSGPECKLAIPLTDMGGTRGWEADLEMKTKS